MISTDIGWPTHRDFDLRRREVAAEQDITRVHMSGGEWWERMVRELVQNAQDLEVFFEIGLPPNHPLIVGFSMINQAFWGYPSFRKHPFGLENGENMEKHGGDV